MKNKVHLTINAWLLFIYTFLFYFIFIDFTFALSSFSKLNVRIFMFAYVCKNSFLKVGYYLKMQKKNNISLFVHGYYSPMYFYFIDFIFTLASFCKTCFHLFTYACVCKF